MNELGYTLAGTPGNCSQLVNKEKTNGALLFRLNLTDAAAPVGD